MQNELNEIEGEILFKDSDIYKKYEAIKVLIINKLIERTRICDSVLLSIWISVDICVAQLNM